MGDSDFKTVAGVALLVMAPSVSLAACGGGGGGTTTVSDQEFIAKADAICRPFNAPLASFEARLNRAGSGAEAVAISRAEDAREVPFVRRLNALKPPPDLAVKWNQYITALNAQQRATRQQTTAMARTDTATFQALNGVVDDAANRKATAAQRIGFAVCGRNPK